MKKGLTVNEMGAIALAFAILAIIISVGATILAQTQSTQGSLTEAYTNIGYGLTGLTTMAGWLPTIAVIIAAAVVIGIIVGYFRGG